MKTKQIFAVLAAAACMTVCAQATVEKAVRSYHRASAAYGRAEYYRIAGKTNEYLVYFQWKLPVMGKSDGGVMVGLPEPNFWTGFIARDFMTLTVNGIKSNTLEPRSITPFTKDGCAGIDALYNFDGVRMTLRFWMDGESPLLRMRWIRDEASEPVKSAVLAMECRPSFCVPNGGKRDSSYRREAASPVRTFTPKLNTTAWFYLKPDDTRLTFYDSHYQVGGPEPKAEGPAMLTIDWSGIQSGRFWMGNIYGVNLEFNLDPGFREVTFGILELKKHMTNTDFFQFSKNVK